MFQVHGPTRQEPGCLSYGAFQSVRDPDEFYIHAFPEGKPHSSFVWFHFRVEGCQDRQFTFHVLRLISGGGHVQGDGTGGFWRRRCSNRASEKKPTLQPRSSQPRTVLRCLKNGS